MKKWMLLLALARELKGENVLSPDAVRAAIERVIRKELGEEDGAQTGKGVEQAGRKKVV